MLRPVPVPDGGAGTAPGPARYTRPQEAPVLSREQIQIKTPEQVRLMRRAGLVVADIHAAPVSYTHLTLPTIYSV